MPLRLVNCEETLLGLIKKNTTTTVFLASFYGSAMASEEAQEGKIDWDLINTLIVDKWGIDVFRYVINYATSVKNNIFVLEKKKKIEEKNKRIEAINNMKSGTAPEHLVHKELPPETEYYEDSYSDY